MALCSGCGASLPPNKAPGPKRKWCSPKCRKTTLYSIACEVCGRRDNGSEGKRDSYICAECQHEAVYGERNRRIFEAWERGESAPEIASREGMMASAVSSLVGYRRLGGLPLKLHRRRNRTLWPEIERMWNDGASGREIADALDTTVQNVWVMVGTMREKGIALPFRIGLYSEADRANAVELYRYGLSITKVADRCGIPRGSVDAILRKAGVTRSRAEAQRLRRAA